VREGEEIHNTYFSMGMGERGGKGEGGRGEGAKMNK